MPYCIREFITKIMLVGFKPMETPYDKNWWKTPGVYFWSVEKRTEADDSAGPAKRARV